jgi:hypothetical protein
MGIRFDIGDYVFQAIDYQVSEDATPLAAGDSTGSVGTFSVTVPLPDLDLPLDQETSGQAIIRKYGVEFLRNMDARVLDTTRGFTTGRVDDISVSQSSGTITFTCLTRLAAINVYNIQAQPYVGTLAGAFAYYLGLAGITDPTDWQVDTSVASRPVSYIGWYGELWQHMKMMLASEACEIALVSGVIVLRPVRTRVADLGRLVTRDRSTSTVAPAQFVEFYTYERVPVTNGVVYPIEGVVPDRISIPADQTVEVDIDLGGSISSIQQPGPVSTMEGFPGSSVYVVTTEDGTAVSPTVWTGTGGKVEVVINPETTTAILRITAGHSLNADKSSPTNYYLTSGGSDGTPALQLVGTGVLFSAVKQRMATGMAPTEASTEVGITVDNPFISPENMGRMAPALAREYARMSPSLSGTAVSLSRNGADAGTLLPTYQEVEDELIGAVGHAPSQAEAIAYYQSLGLYTYGDVEAYYAERTMNEFDNQVFGNVQGSRIWDAATRRWYRIRKADITSGIVSFDADDDLLVSDMQELYAGLTYAQVQEIFAGMTYRQAEGLGMFSE